MSLVVRIRADVSALTSGFQAAIQSAEAFEKQLKQLGSQQHLMGALRTDLFSTRTALDKSAKSFSEFSKDAAKGANSLSQATAKLDSKLGGLDATIQKVIASLRKLAYISWDALNLAIQQFEKFHAAANGALAPVAALGREVAASSRDVAAGTRAVQRADEAVRRANQGVMEGSSLWTRFAVSLGGALVGSVVSQILWRLGDSIIRLPGMMIELAGSLEQTQIALNTMVGSGEKATKFLKDLQQFAVETPFEFEGLMKASKLLMAMGINSKAILPILRAVGDSLAAVGGTSYQIENVSRALAQMAAKGKLNAEELNQLAENGIPAVDMLAKKIGVSAGKIMEMAEKSQLAAAKYLPMLVNEMERRFSGQMEKQNKTITGSLAMLSDAFKLTFGEIGKRLIEISGLTDRVRSLAAAFLALGKAVRDQGLPGLFTAAFGKNSQNFAIGMATAIGALSYAAIRMASQVLLASQAMAGLRAAIIATSVATIKQTLLFAAIGATAFAIGVNMKYVIERFAYFGKMSTIIIQNVAEKLALVIERIREVGSIDLDDLVTGNWRNIMSSGYENFWSNWKDITEKNTTAIAQLWATPFEEKFVNPIEAAKKAYSSFASMLDEKTSSIKLGTEKLTTSLLGIAGGIETAAKSNDKLAKKQAEAANKAQATANAYANLQTRLQEIIAKEIELGYAYDENKAIADALQPVIEKLTAQYDIRSAQVKEMIALQQRYRKMSVEVSQVEQRRYAEIKDIVAISTRLSANLKAINEDMDDQGASFNVAEKQAKAYKQALKELRNVKIADSAGLQNFMKKVDFSKLGNIGQGLLDSIAKAIKSGNVKALEKALGDVIGSLDVKANEFDVAKIIGDAETQFETAKKVAIALGEAWDEAAERGKMLTTIVTKLTENGTKPATDAVEGYKKKLEELRSPFDQMILKTSAATGLLGALSGAFSSITDLLSTFGLNIGGSARAVVDFVTKAVTGIGGVVTAIATLGAAWKTFSDAMQKDPTYLTLTLIIAGISLVVGGIMTWMDAEKKKAEQSAKFNKEYAQQLAENNQKLQEMVTNANEAYENRGEIVRILSAEEENSVIALVAQYESLQLQLLDAVNLSADAQQKIRDDIAETQKQLSDLLPAGVASGLRSSNEAFRNSVMKWNRTGVKAAEEAAAKIGNAMKGGVIESLKSAGKAFLEGADDWQWKLREGIRDSIVSGIVDAMVKKSVIDVIMPDIERLATTLQKGVAIKPSEVSAIFSKADMLGNKLQSVLGPIRDVITGFKTEAPKFNEAFSGVIGGANQLMSNALMNNDVLGVGRAALEFQAAQAGAYGGTTVNVNYTGYGKGWSDKDARELGEKIVAQLRRSGNG
jgi:tape measure domain-containing protein